MDSLNYNVIQKALIDNQLTLHPSEAHGLVCGVICGERHEVLPIEWSAIIAEGEPFKTNAILNSLYDYSKKQLKEFSFEFQALLPDDAESLTLRAEALTLWAQGFLTGLKLRQIPLVNRDKSDVSEAIMDMVEIAKMNYESVHESEEDENDYMELTEYIRMAVILIYQDLHSNKQQTEDEKMSDTPLH